MTINKNDIVRERKSRLFDEGKNLLVSSVDQSGIETDQGKLVAVTDGRDTFWVTAKELKVVLPCGVTDNFKVRLVHGCYRPLVDFDNVTTQEFLTAKSIISTEPLIKTREDHLRRLGILDKLVIKNDKEK